MHRETKPIDISDLPELLKLAEEVQASQTARLLKHGQDDIAVLSPVDPAARPKRAAPSRAGSASPNDWLLRLADIAGDAVPTDQATDISSNKYKYLAEAYADLHQTGK